MTSLRVTPEVEQKLDVMCKDVTDSWCRLFFLWLLVRLMRPVKAFLE